MKKIYLAIATLFWCGAVFFASTSLYWRDSGEFILSAFYLDISHPAGFPLYGQLANLLALFPGGPIAWRVNLFSGVISAINLILIWTLAFKLLSNEFSIQKIKVHILSSIAPCLLIGSNAFLKQAVTTEVYPLNTLFYLLLFLAYYEYLRSKDLRYVLFAAFISGISLGNHISLGGPILLALIFLSIDIKQLKAAIVPSILLGMFGLGIYGYLPQRASANTPLATGYPNSITRAINSMTDARDRNLKNHGGSEGGDVAFSLPFARAAANAVGDSKKLFDEMNLVFVLIGILGAGALIKKNWRAGTLLLLSALSIWAFFNGWDPDPWGPLFAAIAIFASIGCALPLEMLGEINCSKLRHALSVSLVLIVCMFFSIRNIRLADLNKLSQFVLPEVTARNLITKVPHGGAIITENSWFLLAYVKFIEGFREDVTIFYQPRLLFPYFFEPIDLVDSNGIKFTTSTSLNTESSEPNMSTLADLINYLSTRGALYIEPNISINSFLKQVAILRGDGAVELSYGKQAQVFDSYVTTRLLTLTPNIAVASQTDGEITTDSQNYLEGILVNESDLLVQMGKPELALTMYEQGCANCSKTALKNIELIKELIEKGREK